MKSLYRRERFIRGGIRAAYLFIVMGYLFPLFWIVSASLREMGELFRFPPRLIPVSPTLANYHYILTATRIPLNILNTAWIVAMTIVLSILISMPAAYALSRFRIRRKKFVLFGILLFHMISPMVICIPMYRYFSRIGLLNTHLGVILMYAAWQVPFCTWVIKGFLDSIPTELDEAALIDGCSRVSSLLLILFPTSLPGLVSTAILIGMNGWAQFIIPFIMLDREQLYPVSVGILNFQTIHEAVEIHLVATASVLSILPVVAVFVILQRRIVRALTAGSVKG